MSTEDTISGRIDELSGKGKEVAGRATGNPGPEAEGRAEQATSNLEQAGEKVEDVCTWAGRSPPDRPVAGRAGQRPRCSGGTQPIDGATWRAIVSSSRALYSTPSMLGTVSSRVSASRTAASLASSSASWSGSPT
jgi:uncharacterized protein YjbJ (UPF0337 family)